MHRLMWSGRVQGECEANPIYMVGNEQQKAHCSLSCGTCAPSFPSGQPLCGPLPTAILPAMCFLQLQLKDYITMWAVSSDSVCVLPGCTGPNCDAEHTCFIRSQNL